MVKFPALLLTRVIGLEQPLFGRQTDRRTGYLKSSCRQGEGIHEAKLSLG